LILQIAPTGPETLHGLLPRFAQRQTDDMANRHRDQIRITLSFDRANCCAARLAGPEFQPNNRSHFRRPTDVSSQNEVRRLPFGCLKNSMTTAAKIAKALAGPSARPTNGRVFSQQTDDKQQ